MGSVKTVTILKNAELAAGKTGHWVWNNMKPAGGVWFVDLAPGSTGSTSTGFNEHVTLEVTKQWRELKIVENAPPNSQISDTSIEHELHYKVKNWGSKKARFSVNVAIMT